MIRNEAKAYLRLMATITLLCLAVVVGVTGFTHLVDTLYGWNSFNLMWYAYGAGFVLTICIFVTFVAIPVIEAINSLKK